MLKRIGKLVLGEYQNYKGEREYYTFYDDDYCENDVATIEVDLENKQIYLTKVDYLSYENLDAIYSYMDELKKEL